VQYENLVTAWYGARALGGSATPIGLGLPVDTSIMSIRCQTEAAVDDILVETVPKGFVFVQCKRKVELSERPDSPFADALDQFVRQWILCEDRVDALHWAKPLDSTRDRLVLATTSETSAPVARTLSALLRRVRDAGGVSCIDQVTTSVGDRRVAEKVMAILRRSYRSNRNRDPSEGELSRIQQLIWVQILDVAEEGDAARTAQESLAAAVLANANQAPLAWNTLGHISARLASERSGKTVPTLRSELHANGIILRSPPSYDLDINNLRAWSRTKLAQDSVFTRLSPNDPESAIRRDVFDPLMSAAEATSLLVTGEPGAGKSGVIYELAKSLEEGGGDVLFLSVDRLPVSTASELAAELRITKDLVDVMANWEGEDPGYVIIDALDAARNFSAQIIFRELIASILGLGGRWRVVASVRKYDLRYSVQ